MNDADIGRLRYISTETMIEGIIVEVHDASVVIDLKGRLGQFRLPRRMIISEYDLAVGQEVGFVMSYPEVLDEEVNPHYLNAIVEHKKRAQALKKGE